MPEIDITEEFLKDNLQGMSDEVAKRKLEMPVVYTGLILGLIPEFYGYKPEELFKEITIQQDGSREHLTHLNTTFKKGDKECKLDVNYLITGLPYKYANEYLRGPCADIRGDTISADVMCGELYLPKLENTSIALNIYLDIEPQNANLGRETFLKRGKFYNSQNTSSTQVSGDETYKEVGKAYSLWLCAETNSKMNFINDSGVYRSMEIVGNYDMDRHCLSNIENTNLEEVIVVSLQKLLEKYKTRKNESDRALYRALRILVDKATYEDIEELAEVYNTKLTMKGGAIMTEQFGKEYYERGEAKGKAEGKEEGITAMIQLLEEQKLPKEKIIAEIVKYFGDTDLVKEVLKKNNV